MVHNILFKVQRSEYFFGGRGEKNSSTGGGWGIFLPLYMTIIEKNVFFKKTNLKKLECIDLFFFFVNSNVHRVDRYSNSMYVCCSLWL